MRLDELFLETFEINDGMSVVILSLLDFADIAVYVYCCSLYLFNYFSL